MWLISRRKDSENFLVQIAALNRAVNFFAPNRILKYLYLSFMGRLISSGYCTFRLGINNRLKGYGTVYIILEKGF